MKDPRISSGAMLRVGFILAANGDAMNAAVIYREAARSDNLAVASEARRCLDRLIRERTTEH